MSQAAICFSSFFSLLIFQLPGRLLGQLVGPGLLDLALELLDRLALGVVDQDLLLALRLLEREPGLLERQLFRDLGRLRDIALLDTCAVPSRAGLRSATGRTRPA